METKEHKPKYTVEELRVIEFAKENERLAEEARLKGEVLCAEVTFPSKMQRDLGVSGFTMKANELESFVENELDNSDSNSITFTIKFSMKTNKWIERLPEADI